MIKKLHHQQRLARLRVQRQQIARRLEGQLSAGLIEQHAVNVFNRRRVQIQQRHRGLHGLGDGIEEQHAQAFFGGQRHDVEFGGDNARERPFAAAQDVVQVAGIAEKTVQAIPRPALGQAFRHALLDLQAVELDQVFHQFALRAQRVFARPDPADAPIRQHNLQRPHVLGGGAIDRGVGAGGIARDHAAQGGPRTGGHVRTKTKPERFEERVELVQHHARPDLHRPRFAIELADAVVVPGKIHHHPVAQRAARQTGARAAGGHGQSGFRRRADDGAGLPAIPGKRDRRRFNLVDRGVGGIKLAREVIEGDGTVGCRQRRQLLGWGHRTGIRLGGRW